MRTATSAEIARKTRAVANHRSMRRISPGPMGALCRHRNRCRSAWNDNRVNSPVRCQRYYCLQAKKSKRNLSTGLAYLGSWGYSSDHEANLQASARSGILVRRGSLELRGYASPQLDDRQVAFATTLGQS